MGRARPVELELELKKQPQQERARATFEAIVEACARLMVEGSYATVTTNHIAAAAEVGIASLYEYFPGKDAIVAVVAERLLARVTTRLIAAVPEVLAAPPLEAARFWIERIYEVLLAERDLVAVFVSEVPYTNRLPAVRAIGPRLLEVSRTLRAQAGGRLHLEHEAATLHLMINLTRSTILELVLDPPSHLSRDEIIAALADRITQWASG